jgi:hypothetical protein
MAGNGSTRREHGKHGAVGSPKVQLANLFASQHHRAAKFSVGALKFGHGFVRLGYQAAAASATRIGAAWAGCRLGQGFCLRPAGTSWVVSERSLGVIGNLHSSRYCHLNYVHD